MPKVCTENVDAVDTGCRDVATGARTHADGKGTLAPGLQPEGGSILGGLKSRPPKADGTHATGREGASHGRPDLHESEAKAALRPGYIHTLQVVGPDSLAEDTRKKNRMGGLTATAIGTGPFKAYQQNTRTGLMLGQDTPMIVGAKKDMGTNVLMTDPHYQNVLRQAPASSPDEHSHAVRATLERYYAQEEADTDIRRPHIFESTASLKAKYQEMARRQNGTAPDKSSKYVLADALKQHVPAFAAGAPARPFSEYRDQLNGKLTPEQHASIDHSLPKLGAMPPERQMAYIESGRSGTGKPKYSVRTVLPHNENLLAPRPQDVQAIFVSPHAPEAALELKRQYAAANNGVELPFMTYDASSGESEVVTTEYVKSLVKK